MINYRITKADDKILVTMGKDNWNLICICDGKMYWNKKETKIKESTNITPSFEYLTFVSKYRQLITNKGSYNETLTNKYNLALKDLSQDEHLNKLNEYASYLKINPSRPPLQIGTYLNQKRYKDTYETVKVNYVTKWRDDILKEKNITGDLAEVIMLEANKWDLTNKTKEMTVNIFNNIIQKYESN